MPITKKNFEDALKPQMMFTNSSNLIPKDYYEN